MASETIKSPLLVITGASGGIGQAIALQSAKQGYSLFLQGNRRYDKLQLFAKELAQFGAEVQTFQTDLSVEQEQDRLLDEVMRSFESNRIVGWLNAAGTDLMALTQDGMTFDERLRTILAVDVTGAVRMSYRIGKRLGELQAPKRRPLILFFGWDGARRGRRGVNSLLYATAKGAVEAASRSLAQELAPFVRVCSISPGWIKTTWGSISSDDSDRIAQDESLSQRWGTPEEVAACVLYLLSPEADFINGDNIVINGGFNHNPSRGYPSLDTAKGAE